MQFHNGTGVRTVMGKVGQIDNGQSFRVVIRASLPEAPHTHHDI